MGNINEHQLIAHIANGIVADIAPDELPQFPDTSEAYFHHPQKMLRGQSGKEEILGLDIVSTVALTLTPIVLAIVDTVVKSLGQEIAESSFLKRLLVRLHLAKKEEKKVAIPLSFTPTYLRKVRETAVIQAMQFKLSQKQAELLADSLIGKLILLEADA